MSKKEDKLDWLELLDSDNALPFEEVKFGPMYGTPDWVRHPERYPELMERLSEMSREIWNLGEKK